MAPKRESESIREFLKARYPTHPCLEEDMASLEKAGYRTLDELHSVGYCALRPHISILFCIALRDYTKDDPVEDECTREMNLQCTEVAVSLREENRIPDLPPRFSPMLRREDDEEDLLQPGNEAEIEEAADQASDDLTLIRRACSQLPLVNEPEPTLQLAKYVFSCQEALSRIWCNHISQILVRRSYTDVEKSVRGLWACGAKSVLLLAVPGVGKTGFLIVMLLSLMKERKAILFQTRAGELYMFEPQLVTQTPPEQLVGHGYKCFKMRNTNVLLDDEVYYLVDGKLSEPPLYNCNTLLASIPKLTNFKEYQKDGREGAVALPVWSAAEIALAWQEIFDPSLRGRDETEAEAILARNKIEARRNLTLDVVKNRYTKWGGTPRFVLEQAHVDLDSIVRDLGSIQETVQKVGKQVADCEHPSHKIVHQRVQPGYGGYDHMFASPYLVEACTNKLKESEALRVFVSFKGLAAHSVDGCKGYVFQHEFKSLAKGDVRLNYRQVYDDGRPKDADAAAVFRFGEPLEVYKLEDVPTPAPANRMIWLTSPVEETVDALKIVRVPDQPDVLELYQVKLSSARHAQGLKYGAMLRAMDKFGATHDRTVVYTVTTSELYGDAGYQKWRKSRNLVLEDNQILRKLVGIKQYIVDSGV